MTSDELLSSGHFQMPFDIVRDGEEQSAYMCVDKDNSRIWYGTLIQTPYCLDENACIVPNACIYIWLWKSPPDLQTL